MNTFAVHLSDELGALGVRVNAVLPKSWPRRKSSTP
ncbi:hypothetical protein [Streptomyces sp. NPDC006739]